jgi:hypothetical protein
MTKNFGLVFKDKLMKEALIAFLAALLKTDGLTYCVNGGLCRAAVAWNTVQQAIRKVESLLRAHTRKLLSRTLQNTATTPHA